ncbi:ThiF family adenylyltransferase [Candidatus Woesearchaeota archaeon]|nr:ThiF family adenylyltransferase [Candidatus Woesearchaeota archaeon]
MCSPHTSLNNLTMEADRYNRQARIAGWNQTRLHQCTLIITGHTTFSDYLTLGASALGIGTIRLIATPQDAPSPEAPFLRLSAKPTRHERLEELVASVGASRFEYVRAHLRTQAEQWLFSGATVIVDSTGRHDSRALVLDYAMKNNISIELTSFAETRARSLDKQSSPYILHDEPPHGVDAVASLVIAGAVLEEIKKYSFTPTTGRQSLAYQMQYHEPQPLPDSKILVVGAGALGNFVVPGLAALGCAHVDIVDNDIIEETNLNRQIAYFDSVGKHKATVLAERSSAMAMQGAQYTPFTIFFNNDASIDGYTLVLDCVDNFATRASLSRACIRARVPLISGGTSYRAGQCVAYAPGKTTCTNHVLDLDRVAAIRREEHQVAGCIRQADPSVIMSNMVVAGMMLHDVRRVLQPEVWDKPINGQTRYDAEGPDRIGTLELNETCGD